jgi:hypothetical protein
MARPNDFIPLNVGGRMMAAKRSTLCQIEGSVLATKFSEVTEDNLDRDENNNIFLDLNPKYFSIILDYLRAKSIQPTNVPFPKLKPEEIRPFSELAIQLGLENEFSLDIPKFTQHGTWITLKANAVATHTGHNRAVGYALSDIHRNGIIRWQLKLESIQSQMFIGVLKADTEPYDNRSYDMQGSYGWLLNVGDEIIGSAWNNGKKIYNLIADVKKGDTVEVLLNSVTAKLSLVLSPVREFHMFLPNSEGWRLHINLFHHNDIIQILSP